MSERTISAQKDKIINAVDAAGDTLHSLALSLHKNPELSFQEHRSAGELIAPLREAGFTIETGTAGLETAFRASWQKGVGGPTIALLAEYDALPELGHACGHNLIGTASVAAALALKAADVDFTGRIEVIGTPAEEDGGGKIIMVEKGVFEGIDAVMMFHPREKNMVVRGALACYDATFKFFGKAAHAASAPQLGISALDAVIHSFNGINALRQFFTDDVRVHGVITHGGSAANIVPAYAEAKFILRAATVGGLAEVRRKVYAAVTGAAEMTGARVEIEEGLVYAERNNNLALAASFTRNLALLGVESNDPPAGGGVGSSDIGNVSQVTAAIHPYLRIGDVTPHTPEFAVAAGSPAGLATMITAAKALAMTTFDLCHDADTLRAVRDEFTQWQSQTNAAGEKS
ncbi:M20 family metallopeptidase [Erwinia sp. ErVv1]|uniref:M20 family metallopeptidase n=1 Tax=Erwinia TaxID=551 RepID=UPI00082A9B8F|nr:M20 family metallopeptidase [Erwinia sp. ErVv1]